MTKYKDRILHEIKKIIEGTGEINTALDFGSGDGWFSKSIIENGISKTITPIDIKKRKKNYIEPIIFNGLEIPFKDRNFDICYAIDVIHHCKEPIEALDEIARCSSRYILIKDHTMKNCIERTILTILDYIGNKRFGIPSPGNYQKKWEWEDHLEKNGWRIIKKIHPMNCHTGITGLLSNKLQYISLYERK